MPGEALLGLIIPFLGTALGSACVFFLQGELSRTVERALEGFAAGVMAAAAIWSLIVPAIEDSAELGRLAFMPAAVGVWAGMLFLLLLDRIIPHLHMGEDQAEGPSVSLGKKALMVLAVTLHNIPEGMAVGVVLAGWMSGEASITFAGAMALALGIAIQNFPEGAIISMPLKGEGWSRGKAFMAGAGSGIVEPIGTFLTIMFARLVVPFMPYLLSFAAGAMIYVVIEELIPEMSEGEHSDVPALAFGIGFTVMMALDVALG